MDNQALTEYMNTSIENLIADVIKHSVQNPRETAFLVKYHRHSKKMTKIRLAHEKKGEHMPAFLISSITNRCNLHCAGCYARENGICGEQKGRRLLTATEWRDVFEQGAALGIGFHLLAGGEPLMRRDVIEQAANIPQTIFPVFTNGTQIDDAYLELFDRHRNVVPVISLEGAKQETDARRGTGVYQQLMQKMQALQAQKILFGVSLTVSRENLNAVTDPDFIWLLDSLGCRLVFFIEYVPVDAKTATLAFGPEERKTLENRQEKMRTQYPGVLFLSFPGDEQYLGGCLAAGRGFFHINPYGDAEACPFSPYSDCNVRNKTLLGALQSKFFKQVRDSHLGEDHVGGCALFAAKEQVEALLLPAKSKKKRK